MSRLLATTCSTAIWPYIQIPVSCPHYKALSFRVSRHCFVTNNPTRATQVTIVMYRGGTPRKAAPRHIAASAMPCILMSYGFCGYRLRRQSNETEMLRQYKSNGSTSTFVWFACHAFKRTCHHHRLICCHCNIHQAVSIRRQHEIGARWPRARWGLTRVLPCLVFVHDEVSIVFTDSVHLSNHY